MRLLKTRATGAKKSTNLIVASGRILGYHALVDRAIDGPPQAPEPPLDLTAAVIQARRGFRRDVAMLVESIPRGHLFVPLLRRVENVEVGVETKLGDELSLAPHLLFDEGRNAFLPVFTREEFVEAAITHVDLRTEGGELEYCTLPANVALEVALEVVDGSRVLGMLVNPFQETELVLRRHEIASIAQGKALPLVGYVSDIPLSEGEERLVAKLDGPPPRAIVDAIEAVLARREDPPKYGLHRTFNPERDLEPHFTLNLVSERQGPDPKLADELGSALDGKLPPPGYIDIVWNDSELDGSASRR